MLTLINSKKVTASELAEKYELSKRTIYRYIDVLNQAGVPIVSFSGSGGGIAVADNFKLDKTFFSKEEYSKIIAALTSFGEMTDEKELEKQVAALKVNAPIKTTKATPTASADNSTFGKLKAFVRKAVDCCIE